MKNIDMMGKTKLGKKLFDLGDGVIHEVNPKTSVDENQGVSCPLCVEEFTSRVFREVITSEIYQMKKQIVLDSYYYFKPQYPDAFCSEKELDERIENTRWAISGDEWLLFEKMRHSAYIFNEKFWTTECLTRFKLFCSSHKLYWLFNVPNTIEDVLSKVGYEAVNKTGRFSKRFSTYFYRNYGYKFSTEQISQIGNIYNQCLQSEKSFYVEITNNFTWQDGHYGKGDSCWWGCYSESRDTFYYYGGYGLLFYPDKENHRESDGIGRFWIMPINEHMLIGFNAYGIEEKEAASVAAKLMEQQTNTTWVYGKRDFRNTGTDSDYPYVNGYRVYAIYEQGYRPENDTIEFKFIKKSGYFDGKDYDTCCNCGDRYDSSDMYEYGGDLYCANCYDELNLVQCYECGREHPVEDMNQFQDEEYCDRCYGRLSIDSCERCGNMFYCEDLHEFQDDHHQYCDNCYDYFISLHCEDCNEYFRYETGEEGDDGEMYCSSCIEQHRPDPNDEADIRQGNFFPIIDEVVGD